MNKLKNIKGHVLYNSNTRVKRLYIYIALVTVTLMTWSIKKINYYQQHNNEIQQVIFTDTEIDPATWFIQVQENQRLIQQASIYPPTVLFAKDNGLSPVTAIINHIVNDTFGIIHAVEHLFKYPFIKEIYIYNHPLLKSEQLYPKHSIRKDVHIEIMDTTSSVYHLGKFTACSIASFDTCYFQDDLWLNPYLDSLYTHASRYPNHFVVNTRPVNYIDYKRWRFMSQDIGLHAGYADLRYGAFISREKVQRFLSQSSTQALDSNKLKYADIYFSIWLNQYPYIISNPLLSNGRDQFKDIDTVNNRALIEYYMYDAVSLLESSLKISNNILLENDVDYFDKSDLMPIEGERDVRSSCSNDKCLFITNMNNMPNDVEIEFNSTLMSNISEYEFYYNYHHPLIPFQTSYVYQSYHKAVDQNTETCWNSIQAPKEGDYFGLYMIGGDIVAKRIILYTSSIMNNQPLDEIFKVSVQYRIFGSWQDCKIKLTPNTQLNYRIGFDFECPYKKQPFKSIRITFLNQNQQQQQPFELCSLGLDNFVV